MNGTVEVCAPKRNIIGKVCAEYNYGGKTIQRHSKAHCKKCPQVYVSLKSFLYQECYKYVQNYITSQDITTLPPTRATADSSLPTLSSKASDVFEEISSTTTESIAKGTDNHSLIVIISLVCIIAVAVIMLIIVFLRQRKLYNNMDRSRFQYRDKDNSDEPFL
nr:uncharacterized protein LOC111099894 isoform X2 [Crassostrea virginica]XP_022287102.1 uncharacterized protein LOC111099894 isoform X2 [Crassostrea virginica]XP_022287103.1 uncharacterized protein LOC111099894 isoform X2 [Crassostrea virginica]